MSIPPGFASKGETQVCRLNKSLYGLKQASRQSFAKLFTTLFDASFTQSKLDYSLFTCSIGSFTVVILYVDDIIVAGNDISSITALKTLQIQN